MNQNFRLRLYTKIKAIDKFIPKISDRSMTLKNLLKITENTDCCLYSEQIKPYFETIKASSKYLYSLIEKEYIRFEMPLWFDTKTMPDREYMTHLLHTLNPNLTIFQKISVSKKTRVFQTKRKKIIKSKKFKYKFSTNKQTIDDNDKSIDEEDFKQRVEAMRSAANIEFNAQVTVQNIFDYQGKKIFDVGEISMDEYQEYKLAETSVINSITKEMQIIRSLLEKYNLI